MQTIKVLEAEGEILDWLVEKCQDNEILPLPGLSIYSSGSWKKYSSDWNAGGPIVQQEIDSIQQPVVWRFFASRKKGIAGRDDPFFNTNPNYSSLWAHGADLLTAACRCYVLSQLGYETEIPDELFIKM